MKYPTFAISIALLLLLNSRLHAHKDYEFPIGSTQDSEGRQLTIVFHYTDGIVLADPLQLRLYDAEKNLVAATPFQLDLMVCRISDERIYVYGMDIPTFFYWNAWVIDHGELLPAIDAWRFVYFPLALIKDHWIGYPVYVFLTFWAVRRWLNRRTSPKASERKEGWLDVLWGLWGMFGVMYARLSPTFLLLLTLAIGVAMWLSQRRKQRKLATG